MSRDMRDICPDTSQVRCEGLALPTIGVTQLNL